MECSGRRRTAVGSQPRQKGWTVVLEYLDDRRPTCVPSRREPLHPGRASSSDSSASDQSAAPKLAFEPDRIVNLGNVRRIEVALHAHYIKRIRTD